MATTTFPLGKLDPDHSRPALLLAAHLKATTTVPPISRDWLSQVRDWPMYANDQYGDCVWAAIAHAIEAWTTYAATPVELPLSAVLAAYHDVTGFTPNDPNTDQGTVMQDGLNYWKKTGVGGHRILAFAKVDHTNTGAMRAAINVFGSIQVGLRFPAVAMDQFEHGLPWTVVNNDGGISGGHAVHVGEYSPAHFGLTTWGRRHTMTEEFARAYVDEAWAVVTSEWLSAGGTTPDGIDLHGLGEALSTLTGEPNPFVTPTPAPTPAPTPGPGPGGATPAERALAAAMRDAGWVTRPHVGFSGRLAAAGRAWLRERGL